MLSTGLIGNRLLNSWIKRLGSLHVRRYNSLQDYHVQQLERCLGSSAVTVDADILKVACKDYTGQYCGKSKVLVWPCSSSETLAVIKLCAENKVAICVQGGNTSLVAGGVPIDDELILSTSKMNKILQFDPCSGILTCEAGCVLETLDDYVGQQDCMMPVDLAARGSCQIGGNVATCAGGIHLLRYGPLYGHVLGLEAISPVENGLTFDMLTTLRKDTSKFRLINLFVGSEGQLGIITKVCISTVPKPKTRHVAFLACSQFNDCLNLLLMVKRKLSAILSSFEFVDNESLQCVNEHMKLNNPLGKYPFYLLVETMGFDPDNDGAATSDVLEQCLEQNLAVDGIFAESESQIKELWNLRESVSEAFQHDGYNYKFDVSLPLEHYYALVENCRQQFGKQCHRIAGFGHLGDGNLHLNAATHFHSADLQSRFDQFVYNWTARNAGSISAEHGIGQLKLPYWSLAASPSVLRQCFALKKQFDPLCILNPGKTVKLL